MYNIDVWVVSLYQEKAFDRVDHSFLFSNLRVFEFGEVFLSLLRLLYRDACFLVKVGSGLSCLVEVQRGLWQGSLDN